MADWEFEEVPASLVEQELTQRDQFNNDEVELAEALVREVIQNSTDASSGSGPVVVRFAVRSFTGTRSSELQGYFAKLRRHLTACGTDATALDRNDARVLVIEDFSTRGLTGNPGDLDNDNFHNFWRRHGKSVKAGKSGGRWGLGKLVFSTSSEIRAFFGLTVRTGDATPLLMGQAVLSNHILDGKRHPAHGFWFGARAADKLQMPVSDPATVSAFCKLTGVARTNEPGLSLVIPYLSANITEQTIVAGVIRNYYFPVLAGKLTVYVGSVLINQRTFHDVAGRVTTGSGSAGANIPLKFVEEVSRALSAAPGVDASSALNGEGLDASSFASDALALMKKTFGEGRLLHVRVPVRLKPKGSENIISYVDLFLKSLPEGAKPFALFARGSITVPAEMRYFSGAHAYGAMVAAHEGVAAFLGDAENPAHTAWNANAEKLAARWRTPSQALRHIRHALRNLYGLVAERVEHEDKNALVDFFSLVDHSQSSKGRKSRTKPKIPILPKREKAITIQARSGGFAVLPGPGAQNWEFPKIVDVRVAYDIIGGDGFKRHSKFDFDLTGKEINIESENVEVTAVRANKLRLAVASPDFSLKASGFDTNRDLLVDARTV